MFKEDIHRKKPIFLDVDKQKNLGPLLKSYTPPKR